MFGRHPEQPHVCIGRLYVPNKALVLPLVIVSLSAIRLDPQHLFRTNPPDRVPRPSSVQGICDARYRIIAWTMNCPGSQNDRTAFKFSGFGKLLEDMPPGYFILGDAAYPASASVLVPFPGTALTISQDAFNYYQSQCRMAIEQAFGIMVRVTCRCTFFYRHGWSAP